MRNILIEILAQMNWKRVAFQVIPRKLNVVIMTIKIELTFKNKKNIF